MSDTKNSSSLYPIDDGPLSKDQIEQIKNTVLDNFNTGQLTCLTTLSKFFNRSDNNKQGVNDGS